jgi:hypothetical protein
LKAESYSSTTSSLVRGETKVLQLEQNHLETAEYLELPGSTFGDLLVHVAEPSIIQEEPLENLGLDVLVKPTALVELSTGSVVAPETKANLREVFLDQVDLLDAMLFGSTLHDSTRSLAGILVTMQKPVAMRGTQGQEEPMLVGIFLESLSTLGIHEGDHRDLGLRLVVERSEVNLTQTTRGGKGMDKVADAQFLWEGVDNERLIDDRRLIALRLQDRCGRIVVDNHTTLTIGV